METATITLSAHSVDTDPGDTLSYTAMSEHMDVATVSAPDANSVITITAESVGMAKLIVTVTDGNSQAVKTDIGVTVTSRPPVVNPGNASTDITLKDHEDTEDVTVTTYFMAQDGDTLTYAATSSDETVAMVSGPDADSVITISAVGPATEADRTAMVTVTATDDDGSNEPVSLDFDVLVRGTTPAPPPENNAPTTTPAPAVSLVLEDDTSETVDVSMYFSDADGDPLTYGDPTSSDSAVATASISGSTVTITAAGTVGSATISVTASDGNGGSAALEISVTVDKPSNRAPQRAPGKMLPDLRIELVDSDTDSDNDFSDTDTADNTPVNLAGYYEDPDGVLLFYKVTVSSHVPKTPMPTTIQR